MRKTRAFLLGQKGRTHYYHVVTRTAGQERLFGDADKEVFQIILRKQLKFSGLRAVSWCFMDNHFHLLVEVPDRQVANEQCPDAEVIDRLGVFGNEFSTRMLLADFETCRQNGDVAGAAAIVDRVRVRLFDLSMFMKELKQRMTSAYNRGHKRSGTLWEGRFRSVLLEGGEAVRAVSAYIDLNPIRAGIVADPKDYRWCSYAAAVAGSLSARAGLAIAVTGIDREPHWPTVSASYRQLLFGVGEAASDPKSSSRRGFTRAQVEAVWKAGGKLSLAQALRCRVRYFTAGTALGSQSFVDEFFRAKRESFGVKRRGGARKMSGADWGELRSLRALRLEAISAPRSESAKLN